MASLLSGRGTGSSLQGILTPATESREREKRGEEGDQQF
jgi:hypothetical protein